MEKSERRKGAERGRKNHGKRTIRRFTIEIGTSLGDTLTPIRLCRQSRQSQQRALYLYEAITPLPFVFFYASKLLCRMYRKFQSPAAAWQMIDEGCPSRITCTLSTNTPPPQDFMCGKDDHTYTIRSPRGNAGGGADVQSTLNGSSEQVKYSIVRTMYREQLRSREISSYKNGRGTHLHICGTISRFGPPPCPSAEAQDEIADANHRVACPNEN